MLGNIGAAPKLTGEGGTLFEERLLAGVAALDIIMWVQIRAVMKTAGELRAMPDPWE